MVTEAQKAAYAKYVERMTRSMKELEAKNAEVAAAEPTPLFVLERVRPREVSELDALQKKQLRIGGKGYDGRDLPAAARFARDRKDEASFRGSIERRTLCDADGAPRYDVWRYADDGGAIFETGTTKLVGSVGQGLSVMLRRKNPSLQNGLQRAIGPKAKRLAAKRARKRSTRG